MKGIYTITTSTLSILFMIGMSGSQAKSPIKTYKITCKPGNKMAIDYSLWSGPNGQRNPSTSTAVIKHFTYAKNIQSLKPGTCTWDKKSHPGKKNSIVHFKVSDARFLLGNKGKVQLTSLGVNGNTYLTPFKAGNTFTLTAKVTNRNFHVLAFN